MSSGRLLIYCIGTLFKPEDTEVVCMFIGFSFISIRHFIIPAYLSCWACDDPYLRDANSQSRDYTQYKYVMSLTMNYSANVDQV